MTAERGGVRSGGVPSGHALPVRPTHTLQRRFWHVIGGLLVLAPYALALVQREAYAAALALVVALLLAVDLVRLRSPRTNAFFARVLRHLLLPRDLTGLNGTTYFLAGILLAVLLFPRLHAIAAALFLVVGDFAAGVVGRAWGRTRPRPGGKSLEGSAACFAACFAVAFPLVGWPAATGGALAAALVEYAPLPLDDNLLIPPLSGAVLHLLA
jgi:glycerol-3-phosphate acyltransferase PlsY